MLSACTVTETELDAATGSGSGTAAPPKKVVVERYGAAGPEEEDYPQTPEAEGFCALQQRNNLAQKLRTSSARARPDSPQP